LDPYDDPIIQDHFNDSHGHADAYQQQVDSHDDFDLFEAAGTSQPAANNTF
jgi:hypothetical protein